MLFAISSSNTNPMDKSPLENNPDVSIIIPIHNGAKWINDCFSSIINQSAKHDLKLEVSVFNDASGDETEEMLVDWLGKCHESDIRLTVNKSSAEAPKGVGFAKNQAVKFSSGSFLCFQDVDDIMDPSRISSQYIAAQENENAIIGSQFKRIPEGSTIRFTEWANTLSRDQLYTQIYTSHGPTLIMPTWFCSRKVFERVGGFSENGKGTPEDLLFFYKHLDLKGDLLRVDKCLLSYRYHNDCTTFSIDEMTIWNIRLKRLQEKVLTNWKCFTIWNAGKLGRKLYRSLDPLYQRQVQMFCDVDKQKIGKFYIPYVKGQSSERRIPIVHFSGAQCPIVICVKLSSSSSSGSFMAEDPISSSQGPAGVVFSRGSTSRSLIQSSCNIPGIPGVLWALSFLTGCMGGISLYSHVQCHSMLLCPGSQSPRV